MQRFVLQGKSGVRSNRLPYDLRCDRYQCTGVSALITHNPDAATAKVVRLLLEQEFVPLYDADIIAEYEDVLHRVKFPIS